MPGLPSTTSEIESPTGCTKQLISVACSCDAGGGIDAAGGNESVFLRLGEALFPLRALAFGLDLGERARDAAAHLLDRCFVALGVLLEQRLAADLLVGQGGGCGAAR